MSDVGTTQVFHLRSDPLEKQFKESSSPNRVVVEEKRRDGSLFMSILRTRDRFDEPVAVDGGANPGIDPIVSIGDPCE